MLAPVHTSSPKDGAIAKDEFRIDLEADTVTCPQGKTVPIYKPRPSRPSTDTRSRASRTARPARCSERCAPTGTRDIRISRREDLRQAALKQLSDPAERAHLKRIRPRIERLLALIVHRYKGRKSRYLGARKTAFQALWTAVIVNLHPIGTALRAETA